MVYVGCQCGHFFKMTASQAGKAATCPRCSRSIRLVATQLAPNVSETAACLVCTDGPKDAGTQFFLAGDGRILVGKSRERDLCLADPMVSRLHCRLIRGEPLDFGQGRTLRRNKGVVATNGRVHAKVIETVRKVLGL